MTNQAENLSLPLTADEINEIKAAAGDDVLGFIRTTVLEKVRSLAGARDESGSAGEKVSIVDLLVSMDVRIRNLESSFGQMPRGPQMPIGGMPGMGGMPSMGGMGMGAMGGMGGMPGMGGMGGMGAWGGGGNPFGGMDPFAQAGWPDPFDPFTNQDPPAG